MLRPFEASYTKFIGTHAQFDAIDAPRWRRSHEKLDSYAIRPSRIRLTR